MLVAGLLAAYVTAVNARFPAGMIASWAAVAALGWALLSLNELLVAVSLLALGVVAVAEIVAGRLPHVAVPLVGGCIIAAAELGYWSFELHLAPWRAMRVVARRLVAIVGIVVVGAGLSGVLASASAVTTVRDGLRIAGVVVVSAVLLGLAIRGGRAVGRRSGGQRPPGGRPGGG